MRNKKELVTKFRMNDIFVSDCSRDFFFNMMGERINHGFLGDVTENNKSARDPEKKVSLQRNLGLFSGISIIIGGSSSLADTSDSVFTCQGPSLAPASGWLPAWSWSTARVWACTSSSGQSAGFSQLWVVQLVVCSQWCLLLNILDIILSLIWNMQRKYFHLHCDINITNILNI